MDNITPYCFGALIIFMLVLLFLMFGLVYDRLKRLRYLDPITFDWMLRYIIALEKRPFNPGHHQKIIAYEREIEEASRILYSDTEFCTWMEHARET
jgi:hypothetical protein